MAQTISASDTEVLKPINAVFQQQFLRQAAVHCPYMTGTKPSALQKFQGAATAKWRRVGAISPSTTALGELTGNAAYGQGRDSVVTSNTDVTATLAKYGQYILLSEEAEYFNPKQQKSEIIDSLAIAGGRSLNMLQRDIVDDNATVKYVGAAAAANQIVLPFTKEAVDSVILTLVGNNAMPFNATSRTDDTVGSASILPSFWGFCHPHVSYDIKRLPGFKSVETYANHTRTVQGEFGMLEGSVLGVRFVYCTDATLDADAGGTVGSTGLRSTGASAVDVYTTAIYGKEALGSVGLGSPHTDGAYTVRGMESLPENVEIYEVGRQATVADPFKELAMMSYKFWHAGAVLNSAWCRVIKSGATNV